MLSITCTVVEEGELSLNPPTPLHKPEAPSLSGTSNNRVRIRHRWRGLYPSSVMLTKILPLNLVEEYALVLNRGIG